MTLVFVGILFGNTMSALDGCGRGHRGADDHRRAGSSGPAAVADHVVHAGSGVHDGPLRQARRPLRRQAHLHLAMSTFLAGSVACGGAVDRQRGLPGAPRGSVCGWRHGLSMALVADVVAPAKLGRYLGYQGLVFGLTSVLGPLVGGLFVDNLSWRWVFFINMPSGIICLVTLVFVPRQVGRSTPPPRLAGSMLWRWRWPRSCSASPARERRRSSLLAAWPCSCWCWPRWCSWPGSARHRALLPLRITERITGTTTFARPGGGLRLHRRHHLPADLLPGRGRHRRHRVRAVAACLRLFHRPVTLHNEPDHRSDREGLCRGAPRRHGAVGPRLLVARHSQGGTGARPRGGHGGRRRDRRGVRRCRRCSTWSSGRRRRPTWGCPRRP